MGLIVTFSHFSYGSNACAAPHLILDPHSRIKNPYLDNGGRNQNAHRRAYLREESHDSILLFRAHSAVKKPHLTRERSGQHFIPVTNLRIN